jgi:Putative zinc-finger
MTDPTTGTQWHAGPDLLRQYAAGRLDPVAQAAVETHVERCASCRADTADLVGPAVLEPVWDRVLVEVRTPEPGRVTRLLRWLHVPEVDVVVLRASANLVVALAVAVTAALAFALGAAQLSHDRQQLAWLAIAPLLPALLVAGAYDSTDPIRELADATPYSKLRMALLRSLVAVLGAVPLVLVMGLVPEIDVSVVAWLLPALAVASVLLVLLTRLSAAASVGAVAVVWVLAVAALGAGDQLDQVTAPLGQSLSLLVAVACALVLARRWGFVRPERTQA